MLIYCPKCKTGYDIPIKMIGKKVECAECSEKFKARSLLAIRIKELDDKPLREIKKSVLSEQKKLEKILSSWSDIEDMNIHRFSQLSHYKFDPNSIIDLGTNLEYLLFDSEDLLEYIDDTIDSRNEIWKNWNEDCADYSFYWICKRPSKAKFDAMMDYWDTKGEHDWYDSADDPDRYVFEYAKKNFPELLLYQEK